MTIIATADITEDEMEDDPEHKSKLSQEGPIHHKSIFKLAIVEVVANFTVSVGFYLVGSGVSFLCSCMMVLVSAETSLPKTYSSLLSRCIKLFIAVL
jgi:hypothetical protein